MTNAGQSPISAHHSHRALQELVAQLEHMQLSKHITLGQVQWLGGHADVYDGDLVVRGSDVIKKVAVKKLRVIVNGEERFMKSFSRELLIWERLRHLNILPLLGIMTIDAFPCTVSEWMENGTMKAYLRAHPEANVFKLVRGVASGLAYLHSKEVIHSDLKADNVLISADGDALISDFGTSRLLINNVTVEGTTTLRGSIRWTAPELLHPVEEPLEHHYHTQASDVWAFGMVVYEALSRSEPFNKCRSEAQVITALTHGGVPEKPKVEVATQSCFDLLWACCIGCWTRSPMERPTMHDVDECLRERAVTITSKIPTGPDSVAFRISPNGRYLAIGLNERRKIAFWDIRTSSPRGPGLNINTDHGKFWGVSWSNSSTSGEECVVTISFDGQLQRWNRVIHSPALVASSRQRHKHAWLDFSQDDKLVVSAHSNTAAIWDASSLSLIWKYASQWNDSFWPAFHPSEKKMYIKGRYVFEINLEDLTSITYTRHKPLHHAFRVVLHPSGGLCAVDTDQDVRLLCPVNFEERTVLPYSDCMAMQFTPEGERILLVLQSKKVVLWDITDSKVVEEFAMDVDYDGIGFAEISKCCRIVRVDDEDERETCMVRLTSMFL